MPYPTDVLRALGEINELVKKDALAEAAQIAENLWAWAEKAWDMLNDFESMEFLGRFAYLLGALNQRNRQIKLLERLCSIAESNLENRGIMATDDDIRWTGMDFVELGLAYLAVERKSDARSALDKGKSILEELGWLVDVEKILAGESTTIGPSPLVKKRTYSPGAGSKGSDSHDPQSIFEEKLRTKKRHEAMNIAGSLAKVLFIESITERSAVKPWDISSKQIGSNPTRDLLAEILHTHAKDCHELDADIPLLILVPKMFV